MSSLFRSVSIIAAIFAPICTTVPAYAASMLRVCADPDNLPFSSQRTEGLENRLAKLLAGDLGMTVQFVWWEQKKNFIDKSLNAGACDALMGVPAAMDSIGVTRPYYTSTYVWIEKRDSANLISSLYDERLKSMKVGVAIVDDSYAPPGQVLAQNGLAANLHGFNLTAPKELFQAVERGDVDLALAWGPVAGYFAPPSLDVVPVTPSRFGMLPFVYSIAVGVRRSDEPLRKRLDAAIANQCPAIEALLHEYKVPEVKERGLECGPPSSASASSRH
jgi:quinoprotein dehydrogenase-associated probable ABC transporter substrate-binding protein